MLVVDIHALLAVWLLDFLNQIIVNGRNAPDAQNLVGRQRAVGELVALLHDVAVLDPDAAAVRQRIGNHLAVVGGDGEAANVGPLGLLDGDPAADLGQLGHLLGLA
ncbi:hypothetical protein SDC9_100204 [bioreactor metagenome]|uniref:Uncharacterized protein n=1 Tax=bioreactor metagenome TaxID=1076179 RepID=A0A645AKH3_9ZZZZ